jgi:hypothetical protein
VVVVLVHTLELMHLMEVLVGEWDTILEIFMEHLHKVRQHALELVTVIVVVQILVVYHQVAVAVQVPLVKMVVVQLLVEMAELVFKLTLTVITGTGVVEVVDQYGLTLLGNLQVQVMAD